MQLSTGLVIAGAFADKLRKTLFAQLRDRIKAGEIQASEVARAAGEINRHLYRIIVENLRLDKGDVVRIRVNYDVVDGRIVWDYNSITIEAFRRVPEEEVLKAMEVEPETPAEYSVRRLGETPLGDIVYAVVQGDRDVGRIIATPINGDVVVRGAIRDPPTIIPKTRVSVPGGDVDAAIMKNVRAIITTGKQAEASEVNKVIKEIDDLLA